MDDNILPPNGSIEFDIPDGSVSSLDFSSVSVERYQFNQNITENDGTLTWLMEVVMDGMAQFSCEARSADMPGRKGSRECAYAARMGVITRYRVISRRILRACVNVRNSVRRRDYAKYRVT